MTYLIFVLLDKGCWEHCSVVICRSVRGVIKKYGECLNKKKYSKRHIAINPPQNTPSRFEHIYPIVLATF